jgi:hypothetical protein
VADTGYNIVRKITPSGDVSTLAGQALTIAEFADGTGSSARFKGLSGLAVDSTGNIYAADNETIRKITPGGKVTTLSIGGYFNGFDFGDDHTIFAAGVNNIIRITQ